MPMTHYMELLAVNQPWNLIIFMAIPVILAETVAITELFILFSKQYQGSLRTVNRVASIAGGVYFTGVFIHLLFNAVIPLTVHGGWRGAADVIAVSSYLAGIVPLLGLALLDLGLIGRKLDAEGWRKRHTLFVAIFLVVAHVAMIFGMLDPNLLMSGTPAGMGHMAH
ncbi:MAG: permease [Burkholderiaceae bacterium]|nr:permease [Burkholderiaceae bacterium]